MAHDLFKDFKTQTKAEWIAKIEKDLKGKDFSTLINTTPDGIKISPVNTGEDVIVKPQPFRENLKWDTTQEILVLDEKEANKAALYHLNRGATALLFYLNGDEDLEVLLKDIQLEYIRLNLVTAANPAELAQQLSIHIKSQQYKAIELVGSINYDPLENLARTGNWFESEEADFKELAATVDQTPGSYKSLCINANLFANAGATLAQQLGTALAMAYETQHRLQLNSLEDFWVNFAVGGDYFGEIAKFRAFRRLWSLLNHELGFEESQPSVYAENTLRNKSVMDVYNNMVRTTSEAMAAVIGGADEISIKNFNAIFKESDAFAERIAKNQSSILKFESHLDAVKDMAKGSYFIEELTEKLAEAGWAFFKEIEAKGGYVACMKSDWLQSKIAESATKEQEAFNEQKKVLIGANKHAKEDEQLKTQLESTMFFREVNGATEVTPLPVKRLSEELEKSKA